MKAAVENGASHVDVSGEPAVYYDYLANINVFLLVARKDANDIFG